MSDASIDESTGPVRLSFPAHATYARVARLAVAALASRLGFSYDEIEDVRMAVGEVCGILLDGEDGRLNFACYASDEVLTVETSRDPVGHPPTVSDLSRQILEAATDEVETDVDHARIVLVKRRQG